MNSSEKRAYRWLMAKSREHKGLLGASIGAGLGIGAMIVIQAATLAWLVQKVVMEHQEISLYLPQLLLLLVVTLARAGLIWLQEQLGFAAASQLRQSIRSELLSKVRQLGPCTVEQRPAGEWVSLLLEQVENLHDFFARYLPQMMIAVLIPFAFLLVVVPINWMAATILLVTAPLIPIFMILVGMGAADANRKNFQALARLSGHFLDRLRGLPTLKLYFRAAEETQMVANAADAFRVKTMKVLRLAFLSSMVLEFFASVSIALVAVYLGMTYLGYLDFGTYSQGLSLFAGLFILLLAPEFYQPLRDLGTFYHAKAQAIGAADSMMDLLAEAEQQDVKAQAHPFSAAESSLSQLANGGVQVDARDLKVVGRAERVLLEEVNFALAPGATLAVVGATGAGKTTLLNVVLGFQPCTGSLQFSHDGEEVAPRVAWLGQQPQLFCGTVRDNVLMQRQATDEQVITALQKARAWDFVQALPLQLDTPLAESGGSLSVGEAQRLALARAILFPCDLLLLDEPTAALDSQSEQAVLAALQDVAPCSCIMVTHRLDQLANADHILLLDHGRIVQQGSLAELRSTEGPFQDLWHSWQRRLDAGQLLEVNP